MLNADYWEQRYQNEQTGWDIGHPSPALIDYAERHIGLHDRILIPGAGRAYEALYLHQAGYTQVYVCDWADAAFAYLRVAAPDFPEDHLLVGDFFQLTTSEDFDFVLEQTFFCALDPIKRPDYVEQMYQLLRPGGKLAGLLFKIDFADRQGPPFGGSEAEYRALFSPTFRILQMQDSQLSIGPRMGAELFFELER